MATQGDLDNNVMSKLYPVVDVLDTTNQVRKHWINDAYVFAARKGMTFFFLGLKRIFYRNVFGCALSRKNKILITTIKVIDNLFSSFIS